MRKSLLSPARTGAAWEPKYPFDLVIAYEDLATRNRAMGLHDHLARLLEDDYDLRCAWWKLEHLADPTLFDQAIYDAWGASMIVLSLHNGTQFNPATQAWVNEWSHRPSHQKCALVTLFAEPGSTPPLCTRLRQVARQAHMDFFANLASAADAVEQTVERVAERARALTPTLEEILRHPLPVPRWGLNEA